MSTKESLLVAGGTGFLGRNIVIEGVKRGYKTFVLSKHVPDEEKIVKGAEYLTADVVSKFNIENILSGIDLDYVINMSGYVDHSRFMEGGQEVINTHFNGVRNMVQCLDWVRLKGFIQIGSSDEYGSLPAPQNENMREMPLSPYSLGKVSATHFLQMLHNTEGFPAVILRLFLVYGPGQDKNRFLPQIITGCLSGKEFPTSQGEQERDFCYIDDVIDGVFKSLITPAAHGQVINIASGVPVKIKELLEKTRKIIGVGKPQYGVIPYRHGENMSLYADITKAKDILEWKPATRLDDGLNKTIQYYSARLTG